MQYGKTAMQYGVECVAWELWFKRTLRHRPNPACITYLRVDIGDNQSEVRGGDRHYTCRGKCLRPEM